MWEGIRVASPLATASKERQSEVHVYRRQTLIGNEHTRIGDTVDRQLITACNGVFAKNATKDGFKLSFTRQLLNELLAKQHYRSPDPSDAAVNVERDESHGHRNAPQQQSVNATCRHLVCRILHCSGHPSTTSPALVTLAVIHTPRVSMEH